jgi:hypothetical protein
MDQTLTKIIRSYKSWKYHNTHKKTALHALKSIESEKGKTDKKIIKLSDDYATEVLGWKGYAPWLYVYAALNQKFIEGWIPDNYYGRVVVPKLKGDYGTISEYNSLTSRLLNSPLFPDCFYRANGLWISPDYQVLSEKQVEEIANNENKKLVYKIDNSLQGRGVHFFEKGNFKIEKLKSLGNGVLQRFINQHPFFNEIVPNSVATVRITSYINEKGIVEVRACYLRVGRSSDTHVKSASHIRIPVNISTGALDKYGYTTNWLQIEKHPDTDFSFEFKQIPYFEKFIEATKDLHKKVPFTRSIGWDMTMDDQNNVQVMEWNGTHNDIKFSEATQGPCYADLGWSELWKKSKL